MAVAQGYGKTVTSGSVFAYDVADTRNSYRGEPTTNYQWNGGSEVTPSYSDWTGAPAPIDVTNTSNQGPIKGAKTWQFTKNGSSNQWHGWEATYGGIWTGNAGDIWTTSYWYKTTAPAGISSFGIGYFYKPDWSAPYNTSILANVSSIIPDGEWHYNYTVTQFNENYSNAIVVDGPSWGYSTSAGVLYINGLQWEKKLHPTPFAYGTRSATQGLLPLVGNSTLDLTNVSFDSNAQMVFDGTNDRVTLTPSNYGITNQFTIEVICNPTQALPTGMFNFLGTVGDRGIMCHWPWNDGNIYFDIYNTSGTFHRWYKTINIINQTALYHIMVNSSGQMIVKQNNIVLSPTGASSFSGTVAIGSSNTIGAFNSSGGNPWAGNIYMFKIYNRALTDAETTQNYRHYKTRFNLS